MYGFGSHDIFSEERLHSFHVCSVQDFYNVWMCLGRCGDEKDQMMFFRGFQLYLGNESTVYI